MTKSFRESLEEILLQLGLPVDHPNWISNETAKAALIEVVRELIPQKATPLSKTRPLSKRNVGWNESITAILKKMEE